MKTEKAIIAVGSVLIGAMAVAAPWTKGTAENRPTLFKTFGDIVNTPEGLAFAVMSNDEKALTVAPGIGKKIAQRVILELKDKVSKELSSPDYTLPAAPVQTAGASSAVNDAVMGLSVLGYSSAEIGPALKKLDTAGMSAEQIIRAVLKQMVK